MLTFRLWAFVWLLLLFLTLLSFTLVLLLNLLSHTSEDRLQHDGVLIDLRGLQKDYANNFPWLDKHFKEDLCTHWLLVNVIGFKFFLIFDLFMRENVCASVQLTRDPSRLKVWAFWHSSITSFSRSLRLRYLWLRILSWWKETKQRKAAVKHKKWSDDEAQRNCSFFLITKRS